MIVRLLFVLLPDHQGRTTHEQDVFSLGRGGGGRGVPGQKQAQKNKNWQQSFHRKVGSSIYAGIGLVATRRRVIFSLPAHDLDHAPDPGIQPRLI
jgi:hypothetical protein